MKISTLPKMKIFRSKIKFKIKIKSEIKKDPSRELKNYKLLKTKNIIFRQKIT